jgi:hypothetical protein
MPAKRALFALLIASAAVIPALAVPEPAPEEQDRNRVLLESWRSDPEHLARLRRDLKAFWELPDAERERLRRFDRDLQATDAKTQLRLRGVMERYAAWLERLSDSDRQQIAAAGRGERVKVIRAVRDRQYFEQIPAKTRAELAQLPSTQRAAQLTRLRAEDRELRNACLKLARTRPEISVKPSPSTSPPVPAPSRPMRLADFPEDIRYYVDNVLWPQLTTEEAEQLKKAEGAPWPLLARALTGLADKHPLKLPGPVSGPSHFYELPSGIAKSMPMKDLLPVQRRRLNELVGKWPEFAVEYTTIARRNNVTLPRQLGPSHPRQFDPRVAQFIERALLPKLSDKEKGDLKGAEGKWPDYPKTILELAKKHGLEVPLMRLPGPRELWEHARAG